MVVNAGAVMDVVTGEMNAKAEEIAVIRHRFENGQFLGLFASVGPSQVTCTS